MRCPLKILADPPVRRLLNHVKQLVAFDGHIKVWAYGPSFAKVFSHPHVQLRDFGKFGRSFRKPRFTGGSTAGRLASHCGVFIGTRVPMSGVGAGPEETVVGSASTAGSGSGTDIPAGRMKSLLLAIFTSSVCAPAVALAGRGNSTMYRSRSIATKRFSIS
jgi:hypothetical protein